MPPTATASASARRGPSAAARRAAKVRRRRLRFVVALVALSAVVVIVGLNPLKQAVQEITLPLHHEDIIRQQAAEKHLDPALVAAVIYQESKFRDRTSVAGARGLMQITPDTARFIAKQSGGIRFTQADLGTPQINIAYGTWYLRYLLQKYHGNVVLTLAAYNAGEGKVDQWWQAAQARGEQFDVAKHIPFAETRDYVHRVLSARREYRHNYAHELGLR